MKSYLKVKIKSLAAEAVIIRREERRALGSARWLRAQQRPDGEANREYEGLYHHRTHDVRTEARSAQLAYAFVRRRPYAKTEPAGSIGANWGRVEALIGKYGGLDRKVVADKLKAWRDGLPAE